MFSCNPNEFYVVTVDETWIHHTTPETKQQLKQWVSRGEHGPKKAKVGLSANKMMATVSWDSHGVIQISYLEKDKTITSVYFRVEIDAYFESLEEFYYLEGIKKLETQTKYIELKEGYLEK